MSEPGDLLEPPVPVDAHAHFHRCFEPGPFLDAAERSFRGAAAELDLRPPTVGVLVLTEGPGEAAFERLAMRGAPGSAWRLVPTREELSAIAVRDGGMRVVLAAGRQLRTAEALEVLALGCRETVAWERPVAEVVATVRARGALPVVPWGFGKWWLGRGRILRRLLEGQDPSAFFLGDNGGRPRGLPRPALFTRAQRRGIRDLPGSDPLPLPRECGRAGSRGFLLDRPLDLERPVASLLSRLRDPDFRPTGYGRGSPLLPFFRNQAALRLRGRTPGSRHHGEGEA